jgi:hypothetical protein
MAELIKRPEPKVTKAAVEAVLRRLMQQPTEVRMRLALRVVDEYAATLHTSRVYAHAEKVVAETFIEAARINEDGGKFFICANECEKNYVGKFLIATFSEKEPEEPIAPGASTNPTFPICPESPECPICPEPCDTPHVTCDIAPIDTTECVIALTADTQPADVPDDEPAVKTCTQCGEPLPFERFTRNRARADGYASACRRCENDRKAQRRAARRGVTPDQ